MASYLSALAAASLAPASQPWARLLAQRTQSVLRDDSLDSRSMVDPVTSRADIHHKFGGIAYSKVSLEIHSCGSSIPPREPR